MHAFENLHEISDLIKNKDLSTKDILNSLHLASFLSMSINNFISEKALKPTISFHTHILEARVEQPTMRTT